MGAVAPLAVWRAFSHSSVAAAMSRMSCPALLRSAKTYMRENFRKECENSESHSRGDDCAFDGAQVLGGRHVIFEVCWPLILRPLVFWCAIFEALKSGSVFYL